MFHWDGKILPKYLDRVRWIAFQSWFQEMATSRTANLFSRLDMDSSFLSKPPAQWNEDESYQMAKRRVQHLRVVNDTAERDVKLFEDYNAVLTRDEEEKQFLLQVVEANRKAVPSEGTKKLSLVLCDSLTPDD